jgi:hypothetical protein
MQLLHLPPLSIRIIDGRHVSLDRDIRRARVGAATAISRDRLHHDDAAHDTQCDY